MEPDTASRNTLRDSIITLPIWAVVLLALISAVSLVTALWVAATSQNNDIKSAALQTLLVLVPLASAVVAAIAVRRTSTAQIDRLVTGFLEKTLLERFAKWCAAPAQVSTQPYPFCAVRLREPSGGRSYAFFEFDWHAGHAPPAAAPAHIGIKTNVFNFEVFTTLALQPDCAARAALVDQVIGKGNLAQVSAHPVLKHFIGVIQGSVSEGYEVKVEFLEPQAEGQALRMHLSLRQKVRENFLASPFLKRYFAEDAAIVVGVIFNEYRSSGLAYTPP
jgi:hypothetical protein